jgi:tRNA A-37 threonylcarbamoyl transferase component Bud32
VSDSTSYPRAYGQYLLLERLGAGGMSEVDLARREGGDRAFLRFLVIKRIRAANSVDEQYVRMFQDEARINAELSHENIAQVYDFGREGDEFFMAMEYVPGLDLRAVQVALLKQNRLLPVRIALTVLCGVLRALQYAHDRVDQLGRPMNIVHRDVNPRNVMLSVNGEVKLIDFGVAKAADRLEKTEGNTVKGKFAYMAPEQIEGNGTLDGRADLYAVALMFHELLTGRSPFAGLTEVQIVHRILSARIPSLGDDIDHPDRALLRRIHARGLALRADDRYPTADAFRRDLEAALSPIGGPAPPLWIADLLRDANKEGVGDIARRLRAYRERGLADAPPVVAPPPPNEASGTLNVAAIEAPPRASHWVAWGAAAVGVSGTLLLSLLGLGAIAWFVWHGGDAHPGGALGGGGAASGMGVGGEGTVGPARAVDSPPGIASPSGVAPDGGGAGPGRVGPSGAGATSTDAGAPGVANPVAAGHPVAGGANRGPTGAHATAPHPAAAATPPESGAGTPPTTPIATTAPVSTTAKSTAPPEGAPPAGTAAPPSPTAAPAPPAAAAGFGFLNLTSRPVKLDVFVDGAKVGTTPLRLYRIAAGPHDVVVRDAVTGKSDRRSVVIGRDAVSTPEAVILE